VIPHCVGTTPLHCHSRGSCRWGGVFDGCALRASTAKPSPSQRLSACPWGCVTNSIRSARVASHHDRYPARQRCPQPCPGDQGQSVFHSGRRLLSPMPRKTRENQRQELPSTAVFLKTDRPCPGDAQQVAELPATGRERRTGNLANRLAQAGRFLGIALHAPRCPRQTMHSSCGHTPRKTGFERQNGPQTANLSKFSGWEESENAK
jgi:hypothetical protein